MAKPDSKIIGSGPVVSKNMQTRLIVGQNISAKITTFSIVLTLPCVCPLLGSSQSRNIELQLSSENGDDAVSEVYDFSMLLTKFIPSVSSDGQKVKESDGLLWCYMETLMGGSAA